MLERINKHLNVVMMIIVGSAIIFILYVFMLEVLTVDKRVGRYRFSNSREEAKRDKTFISDYLIYDNDEKNIMKAWLEYGKTNDIYKNIVIDKKSIAIRFNVNESQIEDSSDIYWEAFFKNKKLTAFEDKGIISVIGVEEYMDTIIIKPNKDEFFYIVKQ